MKKKSLVIALLLLVVPVLARGDAPNLTCKDHLKSIATALDTRFSEQGSYPDRLDQLNETLPKEDQECLLTGLPYRYEKIATEGRQGFRVTCLGRAHYEDGGRLDYYITDLEGPIAFEGPALAPDIQERLEEEFRSRHHSKFWSEYGDIAILLSVVVGTAIFLKLLGFIVGRMRESGKRSAVDQTLPH